MMVAAFLYKHIQQQKEEISLLHFLWYSTTRVWENSQKILDEVYIESHFCLEFFEILYYSKHVVSYTVTFMKMLKCYM